MLGDGALLALSFAMMIVGAVVFTNAVEWAGVRLDIGHGAVGSVLAAVATALPESLVPVVAIIRGSEGDEIAIGAIIGAPFLLATLAMAVCGAAAVIFRARRGGTTLQLDRHTMTQDLLVFGIALSAAVALGTVDARWAHVVGAVVLVAGYGGYLARTIRRGKEQGGEEEPGRLFFDTSKHDPPNLGQIIAQLFVGIGLLVGGAELFVSVIESLAHAIGANPLVLTLVIAPLATELPEKLNSVLWIRQGKDTLALGNVTGAMVFQSMLPVSVGMIFTDWRLTAPAWTAAIIALAGAALAFAVVRRGGRFTAPYIGCWTALYAGGIITITALI
jgi:cation:H+ antiporter